MTTPSGQEPFFFTSAPPASQPAPPPVPTRAGYAATSAPTRSPTPQRSTGPSTGVLALIAAALVLVVAVVVGFVVLAHKDKHTEGNTVLRPIQQAAGVALEGDLHSAAVAEETWFAEHQAYTADLPGAGYRSNDTTQVSVISASTTAYCLEATSASAAAPEYYSKAGGVSATPCR